MRERIYYDRHRRIKKRYSYPAFGAAEFTFGQILVAKRKAKELYNFFHPEPLGPEFDKVLHDNLPDLYES